MGRILRPFASGPERRRRDAGARAEAIGVAEGILSHPNPDAVAPTSRAVGGLGITSELRESRRRGVVRCLVRRPTISTTMQKTLDPEIREKLRYVQIPEDADIDMTLFPDFLILGPQRTGTTWLYNNLIQHPQIFIPEQKELYYFNTLRESNEHPEALPDVSPRLDWYLRFFVEEPWQIEKRERECREAYGEPYEVAVRGEATATYAAGVDPGLIRELILLNPDVKAVLMVRDPVERAWSHAKWDLTSFPVSRPVEEISDEEFHRVFEHPYQLRCGRYTWIEEVWKPFLKPGNFMLAPFDGIKEDPAGLLLSLFEFFGVRADRKYVTHLATERINPTKQVRIPDRFRVHLEKLFADELEKLAERGFVWKR
jgi:hypothetical protein